MFQLLLPLLSLSLVSGHSFNTGKCPNFPPVQNFDWRQFSEGIWFVTQKFSTSSSCLTYKFKTDKFGFKSIEQVRHLPLIGSVGLDHEYIYTGKLYAPHDSTPAKMIVKFPLNPLGAANFVVLAANYTSSALLCTCQEMNLLLTYGHRRSCSILQRHREEDSGITERMKDVLDTALGEEASHDFDTISQTECKDPDRESAVNIDVDRLLGIREEGEEADLGSREYIDLYGDYNGDAELI